MGRPHTPTEVLKARGSWRAKIKVEEPQPEKIQPKIPKWMSKDADKFWLEIGIELEKMNILTEVDGLMLTMLCEAVLHYNRIKEQIDKLAKENGLFDDDYKQHPAVNALDKAALRVHKFAREFGLSPSSRAALASPVEKRKQQKESLINIA